MSVQYATGKYAFGICDRCGFRTRFHDLKTQIINERESGLRVCPSCLDEDHPQLQLGKYPIYDPQALLNARPDTSTGATNVPQLVSFTSDGCPIFNTNITPSVVNVMNTGNSPTIQL